MKKFLIAGFTALVGGIVGAYLNEKNNWKIKDRIDGCIDSVTSRNKSAVNAETTTGNDSKAS